MIKRVWDLELQMEKRRKDHRAPTPSFFVVGSEVVLLPRWEDRTWEPVRSRLGLVYFRGLHES